jgi:hypothetical protein
MLPRFRCLECHSVNKIIKAYRAATLRNLLMKICYRRSQLTIQLSCCCVMAMLLNACGMNGYGFSKLSFYNNETACIALLEGWGLTLKTFKPDAGLNLGHTKNVYIYPNPRNQRGEVLLNPPDLLEEKTVVPVLDQEVDACKQISEGQFLAISNTDQGISLDLNPARLGVRFGATTAQRVSVSPDFQGTVLLKLDFKHPENSKINITSEGNP